LAHVAFFCSGRKPWNCIGQGAKGGKKDAPADSIDTDMGSLEHCMELISKWHETRADFESSFYDLTKDETILKSSSGEHKREWFKGHCGGEGGSNYLNIQANTESFKQLAKMYH
jgi:hypothetical protein